MPTLNFKLSWFCLFPIVAAMALGCRHPSVGSLPPGSGGSGGGGAGSAGAGGRAAGGGGGNRDAGGIGAGGRGGDLGNVDAGGDASSSTGGSGPSRGPTPPAAGVRFPFPQNRE